MNFFFLSLAALLALGNMESFTKFTRLFAELAMEDQVKFKMTASGVFPNEVKRNFDDLEKFKWMRTEENMNGQMEEEIHDVFTEMKQFKYQNKKTPIVKGMLEEMGQELNNFLSDTGRMKLPYGKMFLFEDEAGQIGLTTTEVDRNWTLFLADDTEPKGYYKYSKGHFYITQNQKHITYNAYDWKNAYYLQTIKFSPKRSSTIKCIQNFQFSTMPKSRLEAYTRAAYFEKGKFCGFWKISDLVYKPLTTQFKVDWSDQSPLNRDKIESELLKESPLGAGDEVLLKKKLGMKLGIKTERICRIIKVCKERGKEIYTIEYKNSKGVLHEARIREYDVAAIWLKNETEACESLVEKHESCKRLNEGNWFFRAIADKLDQSITHNQVREKIVEEILVNGYKKRYKLTGDDLLHVEIEQLKNDKEEKNGYLRYCSLALPWFKRMSIDGTLADRLCIESARNVFPDINFVIWNNKLQRVVGDGVKKEKTIFLKQKPSQYNVFVEDINKSNIEGEQKRKRIEEKQVKTFYVEKKGRFYN